MNVEALIWVVLPSFEAQSLEDETVCGGKTGEGFADSVWKWEDGGSWEVCLDFGTGVGSYAVETKHDKLSAMCNKEGTSFKYFS